MSSLLCISVRFLQPYSHGRGESGGPEWPPSPLRMLQALIAASAGRWNQRRDLAQVVPAIRWLETLSAPRIVAAHAVQSELPYRLYVPDNVADRVAAAWSRGRDASIADYRTEKDVLPVRLENEAVHYLYSIPQGDAHWQSHVETITPAARSITHLGWGIDMAVGDAGVITEEQAAQLPGHRWQPSPVGGTPLRTATIGTLDDLTRKHADFLGRLTEDGFRPVPPLRVFNVVRYRCDDEPVQRPVRVFELRNIDGSRFRYPHRQLIHIAGMVRHLAIEAMKKDPPRGVGADWVETYVAGHQQAQGEPHRQLSYLPLQSIGNPYVDPGIRRVMLTAPVGDDGLLDHVARRLAGQELKPVRGDEFAGRQPPLLIPVKHDNVARFYTQPANEWHSVTPVILDGHVKRWKEKSDNGSSVEVTDHADWIRKALQRAGIEQSCTFEWSAFSRFPKSFSAHKYDKNKLPIGYIRPDHLLSQTAVHLTLRFCKGLELPGPLTIGAGRHCGLGVFAACEG